MFRYLSITLAIALLHTSVYGQKIDLDLDFETYFDNREYSAVEGMGERSASDFAIRLTPTVKWEFIEGSALSVGVNWCEPLGDYGGEGIYQSSYHKRFAPVVYYSFNSSSWSAAAGIFPRSRMHIDDYSTLFFTSDYLFYDNLVSGIMGQYNSGESYIELICDWEGQRTTQTREKFRLLSSARRYWEHMYIGYNLSMSHFAGQDAPYMDNVVDNNLVDLRVGSRFSGAYEFDLYVGYLMSLQRDRHYGGNEWISAGRYGGGFTLSRWGLSLIESFYYGGDMMPLYDGQTMEDGTHLIYGSSLYTGEIFFRGDDDFYNRAEIAYDRSFFNDRLSVGVSFVTHLNRDGMATQQMLRLSLNLSERLYNKENRKNR